MKIRNREDKQNQPKILALRLVDFLKLINKINKGQINIRVLIKNEGL
jgi:hypothetical protein